VLVIPNANKNELLSSFSALKGTNLKFRLRRRITPGMRDTPTNPKVNIYILYLEINVPRVWGGWIGWHQKITKLATPLVKDRCLFRRDLLRH